MFQNSSNLKFFIFYFITFFIFVLALFVAYYSFLYQPEIRSNYELISSREELLDFSSKLNLDNQSNSEYSNYDNLKSEGVFWYQDLASKNSQLKDENSKFKKDLEEDVKVKINQTKEQNQKVQELKNLAKELKIDLSSAQIFVLEESENEIQISSELIQNIQNSETKLAISESSILTKIKEFEALKARNGEFINPLWQKTDSDLEQIVDNLSLSQKVSQLLIFGFQGNEFNSKIDNEIKTLSPSGVILMGSNVSDQETTSKLIEGLQKTNSQIPLFISVDQEGGVVKRVDWDETAGQKNWSDLSETEICELAKTRAKTLKNTGFNLNFSPVGDLSNPDKDAFINDRTISENPKIVSQKVKDYIRCHQENGVFATLKHYPGHGSTALDSHFDLPSISKTEEEWQNSDLIPFKENLDAEMIMVGHLVYSKIDKNPATQSEILINQKLRKELGYKGLIVADDMNQLHVSTNISVRDSLKNAYNSGIDLVLYVGLPKSKSEIKKDLEDLVESQEIKEGDVNQKVLSILKAKRRLGI